MKKFIALVCFICISFISGCAGFQSYYSSRNILICPYCNGSLDNSKNSNLRFMHTHICTYENECPAKFGKVCEEYRCNFCEYAFGTVDHLRAIANENRNAKVRPKDIEECLK